MSSLGAKLVLSDINQERLQETNELCGGKHSTKVVNVQSSKEVNDWVAETMKSFGKIDHVFNNAGVNPTAIPLEETSDEYYDLLMNTNMKGFFHVTRAALPHMKSGSSFVNVASISGLSPNARTSVYCATKVMRHVSD